MTSLLLSELIVGKMWLYISKLINRGTLQNDQMYSLLYLFWTLLLDCNDFWVSWIVVLKFEYLVPLSSRNPDIYRIIVTVCKKNALFSCWIWNLFHGYFYMFTSAKKPDSRVKWVPYSTSKTLNFLLLHYLWFFIIFLLKLRDCLHYIMWEQCEYNTFDIFTVFTGLISGLRLR